MATETTEAHPQADSAEARDASAQTGQAVAPEQPQADPMIEGTGPGRGFPWWWHPGRLRILWPRLGKQGAELAGQPREGRLVARIRSSR